MDDKFAPIKKEIVFFLEKTFQISFGYLGALIALGAGIHFDVARNVGADLHVHPRVLGIVAFLVLNSIYLTSALGTLFGVLKRGLFLVESLGASRQGRGSVTYGWECYSRRATQENADIPLWNFDNYYVGPVFAVILLSSIGINILGYLDATSGGELAVVGAATALQSFPIAAILAVLRLKGKLDNSLLTATSRPHGTVSSASTLGGVSPPPPS